jgi:hypothetical protein
LGYGVVFYIQDLKARDDHGRQVPSHTRFANKGVSLAELEGVLRHVNTTYENTPNLKEDREIYIPVKTNYYRPTPTYEYKI